jgi:hypothetical protein
LKPCPQTIQLKQPPSLRRRSIQDRPQIGPTLAICSWVVFFAFNRTAFEDHQTD